MLTSFITKHCTNNISSIIIIFNTHTFIQTFLIFTAYFVLSHRSFYFFVFLLCVSSQFSFDRHSIQTSFEKIISGRFFLTKRFFPTLIFCSLSLNYMKINIKEENERRIKFIKVAVIGIIRYKKKHKNIKKFIYMKSDVRK